MTLITGINLCGDALLQFFQSPEPAPFFGVRHIIAQPPGGDGTGPGGVARQMGDIQFKLG